MKITLGKSPEEQAAEEAKKQRELEAEIQQSIHERQQKIIALHKKQTTNKIIIGVITAIIVIALLIFGTYNTFFKQGLKIDDVNNQIIQYTDSFNFPSEGLDNYVRDNSQEFFNKYATISEDQYEYAKIDKNSVNIMKVIKMSQTLALVYFSADVEVKNLDTQVTDQAIIEKLKKSGFGLKESAPQPEQPTQPIEENMDVDDDSVKPEDEKESIDTEQSEEQPVVEETTEEATTEDPGFSTTNIEMAEDNNSKTIEYYMLDGGIIMQRGTTSTMRYSFYMPIESYYIYEDPETKQVPIANGYRPAGEMTLYSLQEINLSASDPLEIHPMLQFDPAQAYDETEKESAKIRVDKIFNEVYSGINTDHELKLHKQFNTYEAQYIGMTDFEIYKVPNQLGYNAHVTYKIQLPQGFVFTVEDYLIVEKDGDSWKITSIL